MQASFTVAERRTPWTAGSTAESPVTGLRDLYREELEAIWNRDPFGFDAGDPNLYRYVDNDPTNATDPTGFEEVLLWNPYRREWKAAASDSWIYKEVNNTRQSPALTEGVVWEHGPIGYTGPKKTVSWDKDKQPEPRSIYSEFLWDADLKAWYERPYLALDPGNGVPYSKPPEPSSFTIDWESLDGRTPSDRDDNQEGRLDKRMRDLVAAGYLPIIFVRPRDLPAFILGMSEGMIKGAGGTLEAIRKLGKWDTYQNAFRVAEDLINGIAKQGAALAKDPRKLADLGPEAERRTKLLQRALTGLGNAYLDSTPAQKGSMAGVMLWVLIENYLSKEALEELLQGKDLATLQSRLEAAGVEKAEAQRIAASVRRGGLNKAITTRATDKQFVQRTAEASQRRVLQEKLAGSLQEAQQAARQGKEILPGLFVYQETPSIPGYAQHHLWPQAMGGPREGWVIYAKQEHATAEGIQGRLNSFLRGKTNLAQRELESWGRENPEKLLPLLRDFYKDEKIAFPY